MGKHFEIPSLMKGKASFKNEVFKDEDQKIFLKLSILFTPER